MTKEFFISDTSQTLKFFKQLESDPSKRAQHQQCLVFGKKTVQEIDSKVAFITTKAAKDDPALQSLDRYVLSDKAFKSLSGLITPDPYGALVKLKLPLFPQIIKKGIVILDVINDPGNLGTIFRTLYGLDLDGIILIKNSCDPLHSKVIRSSKGVCLKFPYLIKERHEIAAFIKNHHLKAFCAELSGPSIKTIKTYDPFALILGNESAGISDELKQLGHPLHIPQKHLESYNLAVACAIMSYVLSSQEVS